MIAYFVIGYCATALLMMILTAVQGAFDKTEKIGAIALYIVLIATVLLFNTDGGYTE